MTASRHGIVVTGSAAVATGLATEAEMAANTHTLAITARILVANVVASLTLDTPALITRHLVIALVLRHFPYARVERIVRVQ